MKLDPPVGAAPTGILYKRNPQAATWRQKWSQSRVLPSAELAYETGLSADSIAKWSPHPELHWVGSPTERVHHWKCFEGCEKWSARDDLHVQGCLILSQLGLLFPVNHAPVEMDDGFSMSGFMVQRLYV